MNEIIENLFKNSTFESPDILIQKIQKWWNEMHEIIETRMEPNFKLTA